MVECISTFKMKRKPDIAFATSLIGGYSWQSKSLNAIVFVLVNIFLTIPIFIKYIVADILPCLAQNLCIRSNKI